MTTAPNAAAASLAGTPTLACAATHGGGAASLAAAPTTPVQAPPPAAAAPSLGASLVGGGALGAPAPMPSGTLVGGGGPAVVPPLPIAPALPVAPLPPALPGAPVAGAGVPGAAVAGTDTTATIAMLMQLAATAAAALGAATIGGGTQPVPAGALAAPAATGAPGPAPINASGIIGFDPSIPLATDSTLPGTIPAPLPAMPAISANPTLIGPNAPAAMPTGAAAAPAIAPLGTSTLTTVAPGGNAQDAALVERALNVLRQSPSGAQAVDRLLAVGAKINVISDEEFNAMGHGSAHAFYDPKIDTMFLRRSDLADDRNVSFAAVALAHEGTHLLDDVAGLSAPILTEITNKVAAVGGLDTAAGIEARDQGLFELTMIKEARAFVFGGAVARELGLQLPSTDPTSTAIAGGNDVATFNAVWQRLLQSSYNEQGRTAAPRNL